MRTTLKRGVGRGATVNGNGRIAVPPAPLGPVTVYRQPPPPPRSGRSLALKILGWSTLVLAVLVGGTTGGAYLYLHESVAAVAPKTVEVKKALEAVATTLTAKIAPQLGGLAVWVLPIGLFCAGFSSAITAPLAAAMTSQSLFARDGDASFSPGLDVTAGFLVHCTQHFHSTFEVVVFPHFAKRTDWTFVTGVMPSLGVGVGWRL